MNELDWMETIDWVYDEAADVLYLSIGSPRPAVAIDVGGGLILRVDEVENETIGFTLIGFRERLLYGIRGSE